MSHPGVAAFTDTYLPTVNGVTYTVQTWRDRWVARGRRMDVVYPDSDHDPAEGEHPVRSLPFPFYDGYRLGSPSVPDAVTDLDLVHAHTPFSLGLAAGRLAGTHGLPLVASYHTPTAQYAAYLSSRRPVEDAVGSAAKRYERWFFARADAVLAPSERAAERIRTKLGGAARVEVVPNGVDTDFFTPVATADFRDRYDLPEGPLVGYTGRHGHEKCLGDVFEAADGLDTTVVFGGDGPARAHLEGRAAAADVEARFLGFLDRAKLPELYAALDVFAFPSPVETQGLVALEANACGTPVVGVDSGALSSTIVDGETGYTYPEGDIEAFRDALERALEHADRLGQACLDRREETSIEHSVDRLEEIYASL
jgi:glycosyltransferase involved in cell wall biosynthesis